MKKMTILVVIWLAVSPPMHSQEDARQALRSACMEACLRERPNADLQRQEVMFWRRRRFEPSAWRCHILPAGVQRRFFRRTVAWRSRR